MYGSKPEPAGIVSVDREGVKTYHRAPMSVALPERLDASRMVQARRSFEGKLPIASFQRLRGSLAAVENGAKVEGEARYELSSARTSLASHILPCASMPICR